MIDRKDVLDKIDAVYKKALDAGDICTALNALRFMYEIRVIEDKENSK